MIIAVSSFQDLNLAELWVACGSGKSFRHIPVHQIAMQLGPSKSRALLAFHSLTGCDTTSAFQGKGKRTAWAVWQDFPELTSALLHLSTFPSTIYDDVMSYVEAFVVRLYGGSLDITSVDACSADGIILLQRQTF